MSEHYDLHCHSTASDGSLTPTELIRRAKLKGVTTLALTDHDTIYGQIEAKNAATENEIKLIPGIEISSTWENKCFHIVGLNIDINNSTLTSGIQGLQSIRTERAIQNLLILLKTLKRSLSKLKTCILVIKMNPY